MPGKGRRVIRATTVAAVVVHLGAIAVYLAAGLASSGPVMDPLRPISIAAIYAAPAVLASAGLRDRSPLLVTAAIAAGIFAIFPFSLHSFVLAPVAAVYAVAYARLARPQRHQGALLALIGCPLMLLAAFLVLVARDHPACYELLETGEVIVEREPGDITSGQAVIDPDSGITETGCTSDTIVWWEAAASLTLSSAGIAIGLFAVSNNTEDSHRIRAPPE